MKVIWSPRANREFTRQAHWLEGNRGNQAVLRYYDEVEAAVARISTPGFVLYRAVANNPGVHCYHFNEFTDLYYRSKEDLIELICFFDTRQNPDKLKLR